MLGNRLDAKMVATRAVELHGDGLLVLTTAKRTVASVAELDVWVPAGNFLIDHCSKRLKFVSRCDEA
jgi:hypothetical protein